MVRPSSRLVNTILSPIPTLGGYAPIQNYRNLYALAQGVKTPQTGG